MQFKAIEHNGEWEIWVGLNAASLEFYRESHETFIVAVGPTLATAKLEAIRELTRAVEEDLS